MSITIPGESADYRAARNKLLDKEMEHRRLTEELAELRRALPMGGEIKEDYVFEGEGGSQRVSELFGEHDTLFVYSFMYQTSREKPCALCVSVLDALNATVPQAEQRMAIAVVASTPFARIDAYAKDRNWNHLRMLSCEGTTYLRDYVSEVKEDFTIPMAHVFVKREGKVFHYWGTELFHKAFEGQDARHVDTIWPLWNLFDFTPEGRGDFYPSLP